MDDSFSSAKKEDLVAMVKVTQKQGMEGSEGGWKAFLKSYDKELGTKVCDPSRRSVDDLVAFLKTFSKKDDLKLFKKVLQCHSNFDYVEQVKKAPAKDDNPEQGLVRLTLQHPQYAIDYSFPSHEKEWLVIKRSKKNWNMTSTKMLAIDCEMVLCEDGSEALVRVCAVDRDLQVRLDEFVNPNKTIADYRTRITGISAVDLDGVTCSLDDVQQKMKKLLSRGPILVGHSLNNDLQALKLDYSRKIDTSYVFKYEGTLTNKKPPLSSLCKAVLGYELRKDGAPHNCIDDASATMKLVLSLLEGKHDGVIPEVKEQGIPRLILHRIPVSVRSKDLHDIIPGDCTIEVKARKSLRDTYSAFAIFANQQEANEAFESLQGNLEKDSVGRPQKLVNFELGNGTTGSLCVCRTSHDWSVDLDMSKKRLLEVEDDAAVSKKLRKDQLEEPKLCCDQCEGRTKEIKRLKKELSQRDQEISNLNKIIVALTRKQGL